MYNTGDDVVSYSSVFRYFFQRDHHRSSDPLRREIGHILPVYCMGVSSLPNDARFLGASSFIRFWQVARFVLCGLFNFNKENGIVLILCRPRKRIESKKGLGDEL